MAATAASTSASAAAPTFGRFELRVLLGKSAATMVWLAYDRGLAIEVMLTMPREIPVNAGAQSAWLERTRYAARLDHPNLAEVIDIGVHEQWPFMVVDRKFGVTLAEWRAHHSQPAVAQVADWLCNVLQGLAFVHEAASAHGDLQLQHVLIDARGCIRVMGLGVGEPRSGLPGHEAVVSGRGIARDPAELRVQREQAERDVMACGVLLHYLLSGEPPLGKEDTAAVLASLPPVGRKVLMLPRVLPLQVPEALRAIADRATSSQVRLRYRAARTLLNALSGWIAADAKDGNSPIERLMDRVRNAGHLPALPGLGARVGRVLALEGQRADDIASEILPDLALSFELLRTVNSAHLQGTQSAGDGTVLTLRRVIALIGVNGVRSAANTLRPWPGPLGVDAAVQLKKVMERVRLAGHVAQALRPAGYDPEVVFLVAVMQNLGRLLIRYHFPQEAEQIEQLMRPETVVSAPASLPRAAGISEDAAAFAVFGIDVPAFGFAVARYWGLSEEVLHMIRRLPANVPVHTPDSDDEQLRILGSAANEAVDLVDSLPPQRLASAFEKLAERYARVLHTTPRMLNEALQEARDEWRKTSVSIPQSGLRAEPEPTAPAELDR